MMRREIGTLLVALSVATVSAGCTVDVDNSAHDYAELQCAALLHLITDDGSVLARITQAVAEREQHC